MKHAPGQKRRTEPKAVWVPAPQQILEPTFVDVRGRVFIAASSDSRDVQDVIDRYSNVIPEAVNENTDNHGHFWPADDISIEAFRESYAKADAVRSVWKVRIPDDLERRFRRNVNAGSGGS